MYNLLQTQYVLFTKKENTVQNCFIFEKRQIGSTSHWGWGSLSAKFPTTPDDIICFEILFIKSSEHFENFGLLKSSSSPSYFTKRLFVCLFHVWICDEKYCALPSITKLFVRFEFGRVKASFWSREMHVSALLVKFIFPSIFCTTNNKCCYLCT